MRLPQSSGLYLRHVSDRTRTAHTIALHFIGLEMNLKSVFSMCRTIYIFLSSIACGDIYNGCLLLMLNTTKNPKVSK
jgi:hypothetical protein